MRGVRVETDEMVGWVVRYAAKHGKAPTARVVSDEFGIAYASAVNVLSRLEAAGEIKRRQRFDSNQRSEKQAEILAFIRSFCEANVVPPSQREIAAGLDMTLSQVNRHIGIMIAQGLLEVGPGSRTVRITGSRMVIPEVTL